ncbi:hypothetical protein VP02_01385 [Pseudomonas ogarae]|uniref:HTH tetR-type domain-containing protein n=1 Tax=Pseudomonas kilonensis TaxID=132476 RepID=A0A0F4XVR5_9PSED|nr:TetR/AcrR family transcriptional regulator [Pseudomonas ogarae]KKA10019.1 hypothetical protein VP02_01385 [Pseudomonas ogarae]
MRRHSTRLKALELFASRGFGQTGMRELASYMGLSPGSLYNHIESKQTLLFELIEELYDCLVNGLAPISSGQGNASDRLQTLLAAHIDLHRSKALHFLVAERELHCLDKDHAKVIQNLRTRYENRLVSLLAEIASMDISPQLAALAKSSVSLLNNLPSWLADAQLDSASSSQLMSSIVRASIIGALEDLKCSSLLSNNRRARVDQA